MVMMATYATAGGRYDLRAEDEAAREQEHAQRSKRAGMADYRVEMGPDGEALSARIIDATTAPQEPHDRSRTAGTAAANTRPARGQHEYEYVQG